MVRRLEDLEDQRGRLIKPPTEEDLEYFYGEEAALPTGSPIPRGTRRRKS
jgi:hypothetical protein